MAGGVGSRFWPASRQNKPKQFLDILGTGRTLIQQTYDRFAGIIDDDKFLVVTSADYKELVLEQLPMLHERQVLCEPMMRNTAPCIAYAAFKINAEDPTANMVVTPADHIIMKQEEFALKVKEGLAFVADKEAILTLGITPSRPDTGYGYIENEAGDDSIIKVKQFREKPNLELAQEFIKSDDFSWNSGMFFWSVKTITESFKSDLPTLFDQFKSLDAFYNTSEEQQKVNDLYPNCENISIDYGILEKAKNVYVSKADIGWSDLGTWGSVYTHQPHDALNNSDLKNALYIESKGNMVSLSNNKKALLVGLDDYIVVDTDDVLVVAPKSKEQDIKEFREKMGDKYGKEFI